MQLLLDHGADVDARRGDGRSAWLLARRAGHDAVLPDAAAHGRFDVVRACLAAGFPVDTPGDEGATALHHAAIRGEAETVRELLARGAATGIEDPVHRATPLGWAEFGRDEQIEPGGDYEATVRALSLTAG